MKNISFIGTGKMATALISCIHKNKLAKTIIATDKNEENLINIKKKFKIKTERSNVEAIKNSEIIFLCVKPQDLDEVLIEIKNAIKNQLVVSIAAGITTKHIESILKNKRVIRVMPNINCLVGEMAAGFCRGTFATKDDSKIVESILNSAGISFEVKEELIDVVTGISGSGPAFFAYFINALAEAGEINGLGKKTSLKLAIQTAIGTGRLLTEKQLAPKDLIAMVASKKGTTLAGLAVLENNKVEKTLKKTVEASIKRSRELGK